VEGVAQRRRVLAATRARHAGGGGPQREAISPDAEPSWVVADKRVEARKRSAGEKGGFRIAFRRISGARPGGKRRRHSGRNGLDCRRISAIEHAGRVPQDGAFGYIQGRKAPSPSCENYVR
jgi:hypothetical protein